MFRKNLPWDLPALKPGLSKTLQKTVLEPDILSYGRGALTELVATPTMTALMIEAAVNAIDPILPEGYVTIGTSTSVTYLNATCVGMTLTVVATLVEIDGRHLGFEIMAFDEIGHVGRGKHERHIVNADHFMQSARKRCEPVQTKIK
jgi:fluoroacetyl-CoA thioesterase